ncbi:30S ribosomal protein S16 [Salsipaludibacter albus]|uniref:30S ribosomal protein S16 n=1 Tax=Salsipaludibacter albus TaxID=2849650 RepID=UPI001EE3C135|nr:30S ribosomal protein S16 [Salsipaludibacter albus]MBY5164063.1 30S ribosomal protein S16 [Salsipaludibacter albus]
MAVKLRLRREGTKKKPHYRVVAADSRAPRDGRFIEILGEYHPMDEPSTVRIDHDRALYWLGVGAQPSLQVKKLLRIQGIWQEFAPDDEPQRVRPDAPPVPNVAPTPGDAATEDTSADDSSSDTSSNDDAEASA